MSKNLEIEYKTMLSEETFFRITDYFQLKEEDFFIQVNTYFDTLDSQLKQMNAGLRIRTFADNAEITLKLPATVGLLEINDEVSLKQAEEISQSGVFPENSEVFQKLSQLNIVTPLHKIGQLKTKRAQKKLPQGLLALDESWYNNDHDYELELEVTDAESGRKAFEQLLSTLTIKEINAPNKIQRMMSSS
ncbi:CYTH domain-containing protein [Enterococcus sp. BWR-S5]|uniref:CYTH domain-containing protein n=1 Tax=Enterococcus sp. BWR-S5 TaxID=2787714 RepID=UPI001922B6C3|nr:CYTH domain-containing protein [Enterococcus sp. BWR-S5]MBL1226453.1 CYTH domain-containing protein [Enterococcus sp. BWR-S5]